MTPCLAELLGQRDEDALGAPEIAEPKLVFVLRHLANELGAMLLQAGDVVVDVVNGEHDSTFAERVRRCVLRFSADRRRPLELHQLNAAVAVRRPHRCEVRSDAAEPDHLVYRRSLDCRLALQLEAKFDKERDSRSEVVENDADVTLDFKFPADILQLTVPDGLLKPGADYIFEVLAVAEGGNQTITEGCFSTAK